MITKRDSNFLQTPIGIDNGQWVEERYRDFDLKNWGPYFGMEVKAAQPLNLNRFRAGLHASKLNVQIAEQAHYKELMKISLESQEIYYGFLMAKVLLKEIEQAEVDFNKAEEQIEELLDEDSDKVSQKDLLKLKASRYTLVKSKNEALTGLSRATLGAHFYLFLPDTVDFIPLDSHLVTFDYPLLPLDSLKSKMIQVHPDLIRLEKGIEARKELLQVSKGELGPDLFLFGTFKYAKAWSGDRETGEKDAFVSDPLNQIDGIAGLGIRWKLNFWSKLEDFKKEKLELKKLKRTEIYAVRGLLLRLEEAYLRFEEAKSNLKAASASLRAAEALLKGAAMDYDLDPSRAKDLISPYRGALSARGDYYQAVYDFNLSKGKLVNAMGWTLSDYLSNVN